MQFLIFYFSFFRTAWNIIFTIRGLPHEVGNNPIADGFKCIGIFGIVRNVSFGSS